jgi:hypothetical protein
MTHGEATRQLQNTLEARRSLRADADGVLSMADELEQADAAVHEAERATFAAWIADRPAPAIESVIAKRGCHHPDVVTIALTVLTVGTLLCVLSWVAH